MDLFINKLMSSVIEIILFASIPFIWWLIGARKKAGFFDWIGLKKMEKHKGTIPLIIVITAVFCAVSIVILYMIRDVETASSGFDGLGVKAIPAILVYAILNTALPEEMMFRGFLLKRIASRAGFSAGNTIQAVVFGLMHGIMFASHIGMAKAIIIVIFTGLIGWVMGYINEKRSGGSILSSWIIHALSNIFSGLVSAFSLL
ncbi:CPBP family intramembrane glutamic endopeptidase [Clostridium thermosuccinogenes]|uniref:CPBP family intramembrane glutamic endopeptidase n=1 Tax=Clostridium thermosuccinogenes TaxID=84032 RepID=UPI000CCC63BD|nr:CPBP family intramembrane glutamic endopeptidase [Pseudoclostridium thermosuccinogenes]PNT90585.1 CPBP family intramembrane metalloprotease [Pseudoclostridium thermosuccinogenes]